MHGTHTFLITPPRPFWRGLVLLAFQVQIVCGLCSLVQGFGPWAGCMRQLSSASSASVSRVLLSPHSALSAPVPHNRHVCVKTSTQHRCWAAPHQNGAAVAVAGAALVVSVGLCVGLDSRTDSASAVGFCWQSHMHAMLSTASRGKRLLARQSGQQMAGHC